jgi:hypothetical protein
MDTLYRNDGDGTFTDASVVSIPRSYRKRDGADLWATTITTDFDLVVTEVWARLTFGRDILYEPRF